MARALFSAPASVEAVQLVALRAKVAQLEAELDALRAERASYDLDAELRQVAENSPRDLDAALS